MRSNSIKPVMKKATLNLSAGVAAKTTKRQSAETTPSVLKSLLGGKILSFLDILRD